MWPVLTVIVSLITSVASGCLLVLVAYASSEVSDEPLQMCSLIRASAACTHKIGILDEGSGQNLGV